MRPTSNTSVVVSLIPTNSDIMNTNTSESAEEIVLSSTKARKYSIPKQEQYYSTTDQLHEETKTKSFTNESTKK